MNIHIALDKFRYRYPTCLRLRNDVEPRQQQVACWTLIMRNQPCAHGHLEPTTPSLLRGRLDAVGHDADKAERRIEARAYIAHALVAVDKINDRLQRVW
ncbi:hypothetical protein WI70_33420 [Burkholderia cepacia]|nr:hypothetical protein WI70_33420 [Burkholderia cepacia]